MYICVCKGITEEQLQAACQGPSSPNEIMRKLGVAQDCGVCLVSAIEKINGGKVVCRGQGDKK
jgi:bacterioferritin-associated ferredoxin